MDSFYGPRHFTDNSMPYKSDCEPYVFITDHSKKPIVLAKNQITPSQTGQSVKITKQEPKTTKVSLKSNLPNTTVKPIEVVKSIRVGASKAVVEEDLNLHSM